MWRPPAVRPSGNVRICLLRARALAHDDRAVIEVQILDPELQVLTDQNAISTYEQGEQPMLSFQEIQDANDLIWGHQDPQAGRRPRPFDLLESGRIPAQHSAVEEQQGPQGLTMCVCRNLALVRQQVHEGHHLTSAQSGWVPHAVEADAGRNPVNMRLFGS